MSNSALSALLLTAATFLCSLPTQAEADTWTTGCDMGDGTMQRFSPFHSNPLSPCNAAGEQALSVQTEVPGIKFAKRRLTLTAPGSGLLAAAQSFAPYLLRLELSTDSRCYIYLDTDPSAGPISVVGESGTTVLSSPVELAFAEAGDFSVILPPREFTVPSGATIRIDDVRVINSTTSCFGAGVFRLGATPEAFYNR
jgi:hypothetical protein